MAMMEFENLPQDCIAKILSLTSPRDAAALSSVSSAFRSAAQSDVVWERFLPSDYRSLISQSLTLTSFASKKDLFLHLCHHPLLIDAGKKSIALEKRHGKICYMLSARALSIVWGDSPRYWRWISLPDVRFGEVAELVNVCWLEIKGCINTRVLSPDTVYGAYLVFKPNVAGPFGFLGQPVEVSIGVSGGEQEEEEESCTTRNRAVYLDVPMQGTQRCRPIVLRSRHFPFVSLQQMALPHPPADAGRAGGGVECPKERGDGWWEIELGVFFSSGGGKEVEMGVYEVKGGNWKGGLAVQGIEIRPKLPKQC